VRGHTSTMVSLAALAHRLANARVVYLTSAPFIPDEEWEKRRLT
jgi:hypothetical protein